MLRRLQRRRAAGAIRAGESTYEVLDVADRWYSPGASYFRVTADDGNVYVLRHAEAVDEWTLESYRRA